MSDLAEIKQRLRLEDLIARNHELIAAGPGKLRARDHESLTIDCRKQVWSWFSQGASAGQRACGGDMVSWIAYQRYGRTKVEREEFIECLKELYAFAGLPFPEQKGPGARGQGSERLALERQKREILARYMEVARESWTPTARVQIGQRKAWLTAEICEEWGIGVAPTLKACLAGLSELELRMAGVLRDSTRDGSSYMHFRDCIVIPWMDGGEVVFISSRRLMDIDHTGALLDKNKKSLSMHRPDEDGKRGMNKPLAFNLDALRQGGASRELLIVEGPLDAIACESRGHAAIALGCKAPTLDLAELLARCPGLTLYLALDGTDDVDALERARAAGVLGLYAQVCELPEGKDPDDLSGEELSMIKKGSTDAIGAWCKLVA